MSSALAATFNRVPSFSNFQALAQGSPAEAKSVIQRMTQSLSTVAATVEQKAQLDALLAAQDAQLGGLTANSPALKALFPDAPAATNFAEVVAQMTNVQSLSWAADATPPLSAVTGTVVRNPQNQYVMTTTGGREYLLATSTRNQSGLQAGWIEGFLNNGEGQLTLQGTVSADGRAFNVEAYSPGSSPDFIFGRVSVQMPMGALDAKPTAEQLNEVMGPNGHVFINTSRGQVEVMNPELKKALGQVARLGVILPGTVDKDANGKMTTQAGADFLYALGGRFNGLTDKGNGTYETNAAFAYNHFMGPVQCDGETAKWRMQNSNNQRNWVGGKFMFDAPTPYFAAKYISNDLGTYDIGAQAAAEAPVATQLVAGAEVIDKANDFVRPMGPPG